MEVDTYLFLLWIWMWLNLSSHLSVGKFLSPKLITSFARLCSKSGTMLGTHCTKENARTTQMQQAQMVDPRDAIVVSIQVQKVIFILLTMLVREKMVDWCWSSFTWRCQKSMVKDGCCSAQKQFNSWFWNNNMYSNPIHHSLSIKRLLSCIWHSIINSETKNCTAY